MVRVRFGVEEVGAIDKQAADATELTNTRKREGRVRVPFRKCYVDANIRSVDQEGDNRRLLLVLRRRDINLGVKSAAGEDEED